MWILVTNQYSTDKLAENITCSPLINSEPR